MLRCTPAMAGWSVLVWQTALPMTCAHTLEQARLVGMCGVQPWPIPVYKPRTAPLLPQALRCWLCDPVVHHV